MKSSCPGKPTDPESLISVTMIQTNLIIEDILQKGVGVIKCPEEDLT